MQDKFNIQSNFKRFKKHFILAAGILIIIILILVLSSNNKTTQPVTKAKVEQTFSGTVNQTPNPAEVMQQKLQEFLDNQTKVNQQNAERISQLESENMAYKKAALDAESNANLINERLAQLNNPVTNKTNSSSPVAITKKPIKLIIEDDINEDNSDDDNLKSNSKVATTSKEKGADLDVKTYIPSNSFVKGVLIDSLSANTGGNAMSNPTPVLIRITDLAQLPNSFRSNIKSCMIGATGWGDLSTERVNTRLTTMSCVLKNGKALDIPVNGYVSGEDAKSGIKGMVVTHSGAVAAKAALAGFLQGMGQIGQAMGQTQTITPLGGVTTTVSPEQALYAGGGAGLNQVGSTLSQYYLNMLQQISPAIEVAAGRHITVIFTKGIELKLPINADKDVEENSLPLG